MKPFLGTDLTADKRNRHVTGEEFIVQKPSDILMDSFSNSHRKAEEIIGKSKLPFVFILLKDLCGLAVLIVIAATLKSDVALDQAYKNAPGLFWAAGIGAAIWLILTVFSKRKEKTVLEADESEQAFSYREGVVDAIFNELGVPDNAKEADVLGFFYKVKDGTVNPVDKGISATFTNFPFRVFKDDENLYLANIDGKHAFPLSSIGEILTVKKRICISGWNKEEPFNEGIYKQYKITADDMGYIHCKPYHIIEINLPEEEYGIYIPAYELPVFEELLEKKAE